MQFDCPLRATKPHHCGAASPAVAAEVSAPPHVFGRGARIGYCRIHLFAAHFVPLITGLPQCSVRLSGFSLRKQAASRKWSSIRREWLQPCAVAGGHQR